MGGYCKDCGNQHCVCDAMKDYDPTCYLCRKNSGKSPAGINEDSLCYDHLRSEYMRLKYVLHEN